MVFFQSILVKISSEDDNDILEQVSETTVMNIICDSFADCPRTECETGAVRTYTKSNMKPTKRVLQNATMTATKILRKCVKTLLRITEKQES